MRGKPRVSVTRGAKPGITPADAGKTQFRLRCKLHARDHPRGCGENVAGAEPQRLTAGSPPRMRGKLFLALIGALPQRITPADAGKTDRLCAICSRCRGSPPRMRGKLGFVKIACTLIGITPADAGKTLKRSFRNQPFCSRAVQISFNFSNSLNVSLQSGSAR